MKARDHDKIMRAMREQLLAETKKQQKEELFRMHNYFDGECKDRERIIDNYANALDRQQEEIRILTEMLVQRGMDINSIDKYVGSELVKWKEERS